jgi:hypothetical protein
MIHTMNKTSTQKPLTIRHEHKPTNGVSVAGIVVGLAIMSLLCALAAWAAVMDKAGIGP